MIPLLTPDQLRRVDRGTCRLRGISELDLMGGAAMACAQFILTHVEEGTRFVVLAGAGNNGGDGLAVARRLTERGAHCRVIEVMHRDHRSSANAEQHALTLAAGVDVDVLHTGDPLPLFAEDEVVIDALFGIGLDRPLQGWLRSLVIELNARKLPVLSIDLPSGLFVGDNSTNDPEAIVRATLTLALGLPKLALVLPENAGFVGHQQVLPIGLDPNAVAEERSALHLVEAADIAAFMPQRPTFAHKGSFGHALLIAGSAGKMGAALLATKACVRSGAGLVSLNAPSALEPLLVSSSPEVMFRGDGEHGVPVLDDISAVGIGPGMGTDQDAGKRLRTVMESISVPLVIDADAINLLSMNASWLSLLPAGSILTPHPKEFDRLVGPSGNGHVRIERAREFAARHKVIVVLKGAYTATCSPDGNVFFNPTGNPGMAKGGAGDALTGVITGLLALGPEPLNAALLGVYAHGLAGDFAAEEKGMDGMTVTDLIEHLPNAWKRLRSVARKARPADPFLPEGPLARDL